MMQNANNMINVILLSGFLGSGKTTLMKRLLQHCTDSKIGVIINDFGKINIDAHLLKKENINMYELSNGSIFCACIKENFINALIAMASEDIDHLFIEASGMADPSSMQTILQTIKSKIKTPLYYKGAICIVDGEAFIGLNDTLPVIKNQVLQADSVIVNKKDLITISMQSEIENTIKNINPNIIIQYASYCDVDIQNILDQLKSTPKIEVESSNTFENRPQTIYLKIKDTIKYKELEMFLKDIANHAYRIKGFASIENKNYSISVVRSHVMLTPWPGDIPSSEIIVISSVGISITSIIAKTINQHGLISITL